MKFQYVGDEDREVNGETVEMTPPLVTTVFGVRFELNGEPQEVPQNLVKRFQSNRLFVQVDESTPKKRGRPKKEN